MRRSQVSWPRCAACGQINPRPDHKCASVDAKGPRDCRDCAKRLSNTGYERWKTRCGPCEKRWRDNERLLRGRDQGHLWRQMPALRL